MNEDRFDILGKVIARTYEIQEVVAEGGFGVVYRAYHRGFRAQVALKCLKIPSELSEAQRKAFLGQFRGEAEVLFRLSAQNTNIVRPLHVDAFQSSNTPLVPFIALEWLEGRTLDAVIAARRKAGRPPLSLPALVHLLTPVAIALEEAHNLPGEDGPQMVVHRDMKPENLFIARMGGHDVPKILDFGISKVKGTAGQMVGRASQQRDALVSFSPAYGAPEQWAPRRFGQTGRWTDVWGLALTLVECAKGDEVIQGDQAEMMGTILDPERRPTPRAEGVAVTDPVETIFQKALAVDPRGRYQSIGAFWDTLSDALGLINEVGHVSAQRQRSIDHLTTGLESVVPPPRKALGLEGAAPSTVGTRQRHQAPTELEPSLPPNFSPARARPSRPDSGRSPYALTSERPTLWRSMSPATSLLCFSLALTLFDRAILYSRGTPFAFGPLRASWLAAICMLTALVWGGVVLKRAVVEE